MNEISKKPSENKYEEMYVDEKKEMMPTTESIFGYFVRKIKKLISKIIPYG